jgi:hypothetical protein
MFSTIGAMHIANFFFQIVFPHYNDSISQHAKVVLARFGGQLTQWRCSAI